MHPDWQSFLEARGAVFDDHDGEPGVAEFRTSGNVEGPELADLSPLGLLRVEGPDAGRFLQGYATADVTRLAPDRALPSALCTREGRTLATFRMWGPAEALSMRLHRALIVPVRDLLARYIVFSKADLVEPGDEVVGLGLMGEGAAEAAARICGSAPEDGAVITGTGEHGPITAFRCRGETERIELWLDVRDAPAVWDRLAEHCRPVPYSRWVSHRIRAGYVELSPRTAGEYIPQALNLQALGSISFDKGCYLGQEVVARMQYLGKIKKRLYRFTLEASSCPDLGAPVNLEETDGKEVGEVVAAAVDADHCELMAVIRVSAAEKPLFVGGQRLTPQALPYEIPESGTPASATG
jgi:folate-binding protein YgfZ